MQEFSKDDLDFRSKRIKMHVLSSYVGFMQWKEYVRKIFPILLIVIFSFLPYHFLFTIEQEQKNIYD